MKNASRFGFLIELSERSEIPSPFTVNRLKAPLLALSLLVLGILTDYHDSAVSFDNLALFTHFLY